MFEVGDEVGHFLGVDFLFDAFGHEGFAAGGDVFDFGAEDVVLLVLGAAEGEAGVGFGGDEAGEDAAVGEAEDVFEEVGGDFAVGIENVDENFLRRTVFHRFEAGADVVAFAFELVAVEAFAAIDELATAALAFE